MEVINIEEVMNIEEVINTVEIINGDEDVILLLFFCLKIDK